MSRKSRFLFLLAFLGFNIARTSIADDVPLVPVEVQPLGAQLSRLVEALEMLGHPLVGDARSRGLLGALELVSDKKTKAGFDPALRLPERLAAAGYENGLIFRAFNDCVLGFAPALCYTSSEFEQMFERLQRTLDAVLYKPDVRRALA